MTTTFKQFLQREQGQTAADLIRRDCKPFLRAIKGNGFLYRGVNIPEDEPFELDDGTRYYVKTVRQDRKPLSTSRHLSDIIDNWFNKKFGFRARSNAMFCKGERFNLGDISSYGESCIVFPIGPIQYVWAENIDDLYVLLLRFGDTVAEETVHKWLDGKDYKTTDLEVAVKSDIEVMVKCNKYYAFPLEFRVELKKELEKIK